MRSTSAVACASTRDSNSTTSGFNGNFIYSSLDAYAAGTPSEYNLTVGKPGVVVKLFDAGLFVQTITRQGRT
jgi:hypothetical protein